MAQQIGLGALKEWWKAVPEHEKPGVFALFCLMGGVFLFVSGITTGRAISLAFL